MSVSTDPVARLQADIHGRLLATEYFADLPVILNEKGVLEKDIQTALKAVSKRAGKMGACLVVDRPLRDVDFPDVPGPEWQVRVPVTAFELPIINRGPSGTGKTLEEIVSAACGALHQWFVADYGCTVICAKEAVTPAQNDEGLLVAEMIFLAQLRLAFVAPVAAPVLSGAAPAVSLACATDGAAIRYTLDGTFPGSAATLYSAPFAVATGTKVRAVAYLAGRPASNLAARTF